MERRSTFSWGWMAGLTVSTLASPVWGVFSVDIGYSALESALGANLPTGSNVSVGQVEAFVSGNYLPNTAHAEFAGKTLTAVSGASGNSGHATTVGQYFYGSSTGLAKGITSIGVYEANDWMTTVLLKGVPFEPNGVTQDVVNHSWVGTTDSATATDVLRRLDYTIARDDYLAVAGLENSSGSHPKLLGQLYNGITVGRSDGGHTTGTTNVDGTGRTKPDIVAPLSATSYATAAVSSAGALLLSEARAVPAFDNAERSETLKAILLTGATKEGEEFAADWDRTDTRPLDEEYGAGELNIFNSYVILDAGEGAASGSTFNEPTGWDFAHSGDTHLTWFFEIPAGYEATLFSATLVWNRAVTGFFSTTSSLSNLDLKFYEADGFSLVSVVQQSISASDNVEHIYVNNGLVAGQYALQVSKLAGAHVDFALAWDASLADISAVPEPAWAVALTGLAALLLAARRRSSRQGCGLALA